MQRKTISGQEKNMYRQMVEDAKPPRPFFPQLLKAFFVGGLICCVGQAASDLAQRMLALQGDDLSAFTAIFMVFLGATLTGIGLYDQIGRFAGAGSVVPITGFANSIVSPAMEFKREGYVMGVGAKLFSIAGPVLVYGIGASVIYGIILYFLG